jgi:proteasome lid subunit RPN8/RPN11
VTPRRLSASPAVRRAIIAHARRERPNECCGFLLGAARRVKYAVPMRNVARRPATRYKIDDAAHIGLRRLLREISPALSIVGVYHSHPKGAAVPSPTDLREAMYPEWLYVIVGLKSGRADVRAYAFTRRGPRL